MLLPQLMERRCMERVFIPAGVALVMSGAVVRAEVGMAPCPEPVDPTTVVSLLTYSIAY